jgi:hypothetical protein
MINGKMIIILSMLLIAPIAMPLLTNSAYAIHNAEVYWTDASTPNLIVKSNSSMIPSTPNDTMVLKDWTWDENSGNQVDVTFQVNNVGVVISRVQFYIQEKGVSNVFFHFYNGSAPLSWMTTILEKDTKGWARMIEFSTNSNPVGDHETRDFTISFASVVEQVTPGVYYNFTVTTIDDEGYSAEHFIHLMFDTLPPVITTVPANNGDIVYGIPGGCGVHYFDLSVTAHDDWSADSGISKINITIDDGASYWYYNGSVGMDPGLTWVLPSANSRVWNLANGTHVLKVTAWDGVDNQATVTVTFIYIVPNTPTINLTTEEHPIAVRTSNDVPYANGTSALKSWYNSTLGVVLSEQMNYSTYREKVLGTLVTVSGVYFDSGVAVTVEIDMPTYPTSPIVVAKTTTQGDGSFSTTFVFPQAPAGNYNIMVYSTPCNLPAIFEVLPEVIFKPDYVVGPALIEVTATGFTAQNTTRPSWMLMFPDALQGVNTQIDRWWFIDGNGTLQNWLNTYTAGVENVSTTLNWPWLNPGSNTIEIKHFDGDWWNGPGMNWVRTPCFIGGNTITVKETLSLLIDINAKLDILKPIIERIDGNVVTINTTAGRIEATINQLSPVITRIDGNVVTINTAVGQINTTLATVGPQLAAIGPDIAAIKTSVGTGLSGTVTSIQGDVATIKTDAGDVHAQLPNITNYIIVVIVLTLIAALAAIACVFLVFRKIA